MAVGALGWGFLIWGIYMYLLVLRAPHVAGHQGARAAAGDRMSGDVAASRVLGGYHPDAGLRAERADQITRLPVPSLLRSLLTDHLDPGYAAAAERRSKSARRFAAGQCRPSGRC